ncbi:MAG: hypothetical protein NVSMB29_06670 [Candidatus Dormibacteria bacterium]
MDGAAPPRRILVPVRGAPNDDEAVRIGCRFARRAKGKVFAITVLEVRRALALGDLDQAHVQAGEGVLDRAEQVGRELDTTVETELLQAREAGPAIVDELREWHADLCVMGVPYRERFGEFHLGRTAPYVLRYAGCRVLLLRDFAPGAE